MQMNIWPSVDCYDITPPWWNSAQFPDVMGTLHDFNKCWKVQGVSLENNSMNTYGTRCVLRFPTISAGPQGSTVFLIRKQNWPVDWLCKRWLGCQRTGGVPGPSCSKTGLFHLHRKMTWAPAPSPSHWWENKVPGPGRGPSAYSQKLELSAMWASLSPTLLSAVASGLTVDLCREWPWFNSNENNLHRWVILKTPQPNTEMHLGVTSSVYEEHQLMVYIKRALVLKEKQVQ